MLTVSRVATAAVAQAVATATEGEKGREKADVAAVTAAKASAMTAREAHRPGGRPYGRPTRAVASQRALRGLSSDLRYSAAPRRRGCPAAALCTERGSNAQDSEVSEDAVVVTLAGHVLVLSGQGRAQLR